MTVVTFSIIELLTSEPTGNAEMIVYGVPLIISGYLFMRERIRWAFPPHE